MTSAHTEKGKMRLIDADKLPTKHGVNVGANYGGLRAIVFKKDIDNAPTVDAEPVKHGRWLKTGQSFVNPNKFRNYFCSECGLELDEHIRSKPNYCPNCGAKMTLD